MYWKSTPTVCTHACMYRHQDDSNISPYYVLHTYMSCWSLLVTFIKIGQEVREEFALRAKNCYIFYVKGEITPPYIKWRTWKLCLAHLHVMLITSGEFHENLSRSEGGVRITRFRHTQTDRQTHARTPDIKPTPIYPLTNKVCGGIKNHLYTWMFQNLNLSLYFKCILPAVLSTGAAAYDHSFKLRLQCISQSPLWTPVNTV